MTGGGRMPLQPSMSHRRPLKTIATHCPFPNWRGSRHIPRVLNAPTQGPRLKRSLGECLNIRYSLKLTYRASSLNSKVGRICLIRDGETCVLRHSLEFYLPTNGVMWSSGPGEAISWNRGRISGAVSIEDTFRHLTKLI